MSNHLVVTFTGPDRPGLVESLASIVAAHGGSWSDSRMASLAGRFAGLVYVTVPGDADKLSTALEAGAAELGLRAIVDVGSATGGEVAATADDAGFQVFSLELTGADHEGIVRDVARVLRDFGVNIEEAATETESAPMSGELLFRCVLALSAPPDVSSAKLEAALEDLADDLQVDIELVREA